ncbi:MAG: ACP S-malonyltransferase [Planctomycetota bacterium]|nr:ACP S-malonyltransferase [Planctomycetota bacterium]
MVHFGLLFPGQGAQKVGMGADLYENSAAARAIFDRANEILNYDLKHLCFEGPQEELNKTHISQPAILVTSIATLEALKEAGKLDFSFCKAAAGLSLGEYTALAAVGAIAYEDAIILVHKRGTYMQEACDARPGGMASIVGMNREDLGAICETASRAGEICMANFNSPEQIAISGEQAALDMAGAAAKEAGARVFPLPVAGAFHSRLMSPAAEKLAPHLQELRISEPEVPVFANVTGQRVIQAEEIRESLLRQVDNPVMWVECVQAAISSGVSQFFEVGPGKVLAGLMRRIDRSASVTCVGTPGDIESL